tara:strand:+ start:3591 stop:3800 length:210 start_codon:yes stop_codon:yes gene_type:complete
MNKKNLIGIAYVSAWVMIWGTIGSLIDFAFLQESIYVAGSTGQLLTFSISALLSIFIAIYLFPKIIKSD